MGREEGRQEEKKKNKGRQKGLWGRGEKGEGGAEE